MIESLESLKDPERAKASDGWRGYWPLDRNWYDPFWQVFCLSFVLIPIWFIISTICTVCTWLHFWFLPLWSQSWKVTPWCRHVQFICQWNFGCHDSFSRRLSATIYVKESHWQLPPVCFQIPPKFVKDVWTSCLNPWPLWQIYQRGRVLSPAEQAFTKSLELLMVGSLWMAEVRTCRPSFLFFSSGSESYSTFFCVLKRMVIVVPCFGEPFWFQAFQTSQNDLREPTNWNHHEALSLPPIICFKMRDVCGKSGKR